MKIRKMIKRCTAAMLAAAIGMTTLAANVSAATSGISIGYTWNSSVNPTINVRKNGVTGGVSGQYIKAGEQICRFCTSTTSDWAFCIEPAKSMQDTSYKDWYTQNGFTEYDTFDLSDKNKADSFAYWKSMQIMTSYSISHALPPISQKRMFSAQARTITARKPAITSEGCSLICCPLTA